MTGAAGARRPAAELGVILDWDGVVVDSGDLHERAWTRLAEELGQPLPAGFFASTFGLRNQQAIPLFTSWARADEVERIAALAHRKESLFRELVRVEGLRPIPGVRALLAALAAAGVPLAVGTSAPRENLDVGLAALELDARFDATVTAEDVRRGKPDPEVFLRCAAAIAREPGHCWVFEDAPAGIEAARAAGMRSVGVATTHARDELARADLVLDDLGPAASLGWLR